MKSNLLTCVVRSILVVGLLGSAMVACHAEEPSSSAAVNPNSYDHPVRVACLGDSITQGTGTKAPATESYPAQLQSMLGEKWVVINLGVGGRTLLRKQDPYGLSPALKANPDVIVIMLGTNDARPKTWESYGSEFVGDYKNILEQFKALPTSPKIFVCLPVPMFPGNYGLSEEVLSSQVIPAIQQVAKQENVTLIDLHSALKDQKANFPDSVHPNAVGAHRIAECVMTALTGKANP